MSDNKPKKRSLVRAFMKVAAKTVFVLVASCATAYGAWFGANYAGRGDRLTPGETQMVRQVFGSEINAAKLRKHLRTDGEITHCVAPGAGGMVLPPFSHIDFYGPNIWSQDYSKDSEYKFGFFMHEATHTWQGQNLSFSFRNFGVYSYTLDSRSNWRDFGIEQQADIIEDYSKRWLYPPKVTRHHTRHDALLARVVENRFPEAKQSRLRLEGNNPVDIDALIGPDPAPQGPGASSPVRTPSHVTSSPYTFPFLTLCK
jgi:hypothetical protein